MWNDLSLAKPLDDLCEYSGRKDATLIGSFSELVCLLTSSAEILTREHPIWEEVKIFKNIQAKYKRILHCDKCFQYLQRVSSCMRKMVLLNLSGMYLDLSDKFIIEMKSNENATYFLPSRQQLEYVLIRTQSAAKLICESLHYSREAFCYLIQRLKVGHLLINLMIATSVTARLNIVFKNLLIEIFCVYNNLYAWRQKLKVGGWEWPIPLELPEDLESWINLEDSEYVKPSHLPKEELDFLTTIFDKNSSSDNRDVTEELLNSSEPAHEECMVLDNVNEDNGCIDDGGDEDNGYIDDGGDEDNGVIIERSEIEVMEPMQSNTSEIIETIESTSSDEQIEHFAKPKKLYKPDGQIEHFVKPEKLSKPQRVLLKKIKRAEDIKELKVIWENLDLSTQNLLPQAVTPEKIRLIDKMFLKTKRKITELRKSNITESEARNEMELTIKISKLKFSKFLGILPTKVNKKTETAIKPVKTYKGLKELYNTIYQKLQNAQKYKKCAKLTKLFKDRKADMKLLLESGLEQDSRKLIFTTSKVFIRNYL